ncbi:MAG: sigma-54 dependent transcriptional regulator [Myxococcota bacterium]
MSLEPTPITGRVLVVDDEPSLREFLSICLRRAGHEVETAASARAAIARLEADPFDLIITDLRMEEDLGGLDVLRHARDRSPPAEVLVVTAYATPESAVTALKDGAYDYLTKPFRVDDVLHGVARALERRTLVRENVALRREIESRQGLDRMVGKSPAIRRVFELVRKVAAARTNVLLLGESGTGKDMVARALHTLSPRAEGPFVAVNCGAIPDALLESELFGHVKGSFTGAVSHHEGLFVAARGGTLFLDEVAELHLSMQVKLLRALQERRVKPIGGVNEREVDVRIIAATNRDLALAVEEGRFREDLYYRLNVITVHLPPLRDRREDIPLLVETFLRRYAAEQKRSGLGVSPEALQLLCRRHFPGNVRELENLVERAVTLSSGAVIEAELFADLGGPRAVRSAWPDLSADGVDLDALVGELERDLLCQALERASGARAEAARLLGITLRSLRYRLDKHGIGSAEDDSPSEAERP